MDDIRAVGANVIAISPQLQKYSKQIVKKHNLTFPVLNDSDNETAAKCGLTFTLPEKLKALYNSFGIDLERFNGNDSWSLPMPARFIIGTDGVIKDVAAHPDYTQRPEPMEIIGILQSL